MLASHGHANYASDKRPPIFNLEIHYYASPWCGRIMVSCLVATFSIIEFLFGVFWHDRELLATNTLHDVYQVINEESYTNK